MRLWNLKTGALEKVHVFTQHAPQTALKVDSTTILCSTWSSICFEWNVRACTEPEPMINTWLSGKRDNCLAKNQIALYNNDDTSIYKRLANSAMATLPKYSRPLGWSDDD